MPGIWRKGRERARAFLTYIGAASSAPLDCPFTLDERLAEHFDLDAALARLAVATAGAAPAEA